MQPEHGIAEDFEQYDDEKEFRRLVRAVRFSKKHFLYFACCNQVPKQNELIADVKKELKGKKIKVVKFKKRITDLLAELQKRKFDAECEAVFVQGLEYSISSDGKGDENALIYNLNISRDSFKKYFKCPLFLWLPEYALVKITRHAPDFFSVRSGTFYFSSTPEKVTEQIFQSFTSGWIETSSLPIAEKLKKIEMLKSLLAEYQGLHQEKRNKQTEARLLSELARFFQSISEYREAIDYYEQSLPVFHEMDDKLGVGKSLNNLGAIYDELGQSQKAIDYYNQSLNIFRDIGFRFGEGTSLGNLGLTYGKLQGYDKQIDYQNQSLTIAGEVGDKLGESNILINLGIIFRELGKLEKGNGYLEESLVISREIGDKFGEASGLFSLGISYEIMGEYHKAIDYYEQSFAICHSIGDKVGEGISLGSKGVAYFNLGEIEKACSLWKEAVAILEAIESQRANYYRERLKEHCES